MDEENTSSLRFHEMGLDDRILEAIARLGWREPTLIQEKAIPFFLKGKDILARARTGSGKTGAYLIPLIHTILERKGNALKQITSTLILSPSKELCNQIVENIKELTVLCKREVTFVDVSIQVPEEALKQLLDDNPDIVVGTPLKVLSHINRGYLILKKTLSFVIIDEADLMFTYEHDKHLNAVLSHLPKLCQSFITSATIHDDVKQLKNRFLHNPVILKLEDSPLPSDTQLTQYVVKVDDLDKVILLYAILRMSLLRGKTLIFVNTVDKSYKIRMFLGMFHIRCCVLNSELPLNCRCHIVEEFNKGKYTILIASDEKTIHNPSKVKGLKSKRKKDHEGGVSRGIDFQHVSNVVNYDVPPDATAYIHRVGRTARMNMSGTAITMVSSHEMKVFRQVERDLKEILNKTTIFKDYKFNMGNLDGFRYRAIDAWKQCTSVAVKDFRKRELKKEILNSQELKSFFEDHPKDLELLKHNMRGRPLSSQPHLKNLPEYNIPAILKPVVPEENKCQHIKRKLGVRSGVKKGKAKYLKQSEDPLRSLTFDGFKM